MASVRYGDFNVRNSILPNDEFILPPSSPLSNILVRYWDGWKDRKHYWWSFGGLIQVIRGILLHEVCISQTDSFIFCTSSPIAQLLGTSRLTLRELMQFTEKELIPIADLTTEQLTSFYNPLCLCSLCRQDFDVCGNM